MFYLHQCYHGHIKFSEAVIKKISLTDSEIQIALGEFLKVFKEGNCVVKVQAKSEHPNNARMAKNHQAL